MSDNRPIRNKPRQIFRALSILLINLNSRHVCSLKYGTICGASEGLPQLTQGEFQIDDLSKWITLAVRYHETQGHYELPGVIIVDAL